MGGRSWTAAEDATLRARYPSASRTELAPLFPERTAITISERARLLGITKSPAYLSSKAGRFRTVAPVGALQISRYGVLEIKLHHDRNCWEHMARYTWRTERGPIPAGGVVRVINGDKDDTRIENLRLGTRMEVMLENSANNYPPELASVMQLKGVLTRKLNQKDEQHG